MNKNQLLLKNLLISKSKIIRKMGELLIDKKLFLKLKLNYFYDNFCLLQFQTNYFLTLKVLLMYQVLKLFIMEHKQLCGEKYLLLKHFKLVKLKHKQLRLLQILMDHSKNLFLMIYFIFISYLFVIIHSLTFMNLILITRYPHQYNLIHVILIIFYLLTI